MEVSSQFTFILVHLAYKAGWYEPYTSPPKEKKIERKEKRKEKQAVEKFSLCLNN
jgi:hypothetical protein